MLNYRSVTASIRSKTSLTMPGSLDLATQQEMSFRVSFFTTRMLAISGCFVTSSPVCVCVCVSVSSMQVHCVVCGSVS